MDWMKEANREIGDPGERRRPVLIGSAETRFSGRRRCHLFGFSTDARRYCHARPSEGAISRGVPENPGGSDIGAGKARGGWHVSSGTPGEAWRGCAGRQACFSLKAETCPTRSGNRPVAAYGQFTPGKTGTPQTRKPRDVVSLPMIAVRGLVHGDGGSGRLSPSNAGRQTHPGRSGGLRRPCGGRGLAVQSPAVRTLAIDLGTRRVGLALSDEGGHFATPIDVLRVIGTEQAMSPIAELVIKEGVRRLVVGLPLNMDDSIGPAARDAVRWGRVLHSRTGVAVVYVDERLSSFAAEQTFVDRKRGGQKFTRDQKKRQLDAVAAALFLQAFLDGRLHAIDVPE